MPRDTPEHPTRLQAGFSLEQRDSPPLLQLQQKESAILPKALLITDFMALFWNSSLSRRDRIIIYNNSE